MGSLVCDGVRQVPHMALVAAVGRGQVGPGCFAGAVVVIDFSLPEALEQALPHLDGAALISGTTGLSTSQQALVDAAAQRVPVLQAANFSLGVNVLLDLVARAARALPTYDIEIIEAHHRHKQDAPSGTALALARSAATARGVDLDQVAVYGRSGDIGPRPPGQIGIHAIRGGGVVGEHQVWFCTDGERIGLHHLARDRALFAHGSIRAAAWITGQPAGRYTMRDLLD
jgi:4-hydroxy-tetrahydrodipicolinate reductase